MAKIKIAFILVSPFSHSGLLVFSILSFVRSPTVFIVISVNFLRLKAYTYIYMYIPIIIYLQN